MFITNGTVCDFMVTLLVTNPEAKRKHDSFSMLIIPSDLPGITRTKIKGKLGIRSSDTAEIAFEDVRVPQANLVGKEGRGFHQVMHFFDMTRIMVSAQGVGLSQGCLDEAIRYSKLSRFIRLLLTPNLINYHLNYMFIPFNTISPLETPRSFAMI